MDELWCWNIMPHQPHEWGGTLDGKPQTFTCPGVSAMMVSRGVPESHVSGREDDSEESSNA